MHITTWRRPSHIFSDRSIRDFYHVPVVQTHAFLFDTGHLEVPRHSGSLSLKLVLRGAEDYLIGNRTVRLRQGELLLVNAGETYASRIAEPTRSLSLFFPDSCLAEIADQCSAKSSPEVPQFRFAATQEAWKLVLELAKCLRAEEAEMADEFAIRLLDGAWRDLRKLAPPTALADIRKPAVRDELLGRIARTREFIDARQGKGCVLDRLANQACLSKFHFLRLFREVVGSTPSVYARQARLRLAAHEILRGEDGDGVARRTGYANRYCLNRALRQYIAWPPGK